MLRPAVADPNVEWVQHGIGPFGAFQVASLVPAGFAAYARVLHPAWGRDGESVRWEAVARWSGRRMHSLAEFDRIAVPSDSAPRTTAPYVQPPDLGRAPLFVLDALCVHLSAHTRTPRDVVFGVWEGYSWAAALGTLPTIVLPERTYLALAGPLSAVGSLGWTGPSGNFRREPPSLIFPADRAWFVASDVDQDSTYVGGSRSLVSSLTAEARIEAWEVSSADGISSGEDIINA